VNPKDGTSAIIAFHHSSPFVDRFASSEPLDPRLFSNTFRRVFFPDSDVRAMFRGPKAEVMLMTIREGTQSYVAKIVSSDVNEVDTVLGRSCQQPYA